MKPAYTNAESIAIRLFSLLWHQLDICITFPSYAYTT